MREIRADLWTVEADLRVISTNPIVNARGQAVMGRGCALQAKRRVPGLEYRFARMLERHGNRVMRLAALPDGSHLASFPVKTHWKEEAKPALIERSARQLVAIVDKFALRYERVFLPRPGCGNGRLSWEEVRPVLAEILDDRFTVVTFPERDPRLLPTIART